jgi:protease-4
MPCPEQVGVQPEVRRIGKYKSAGDQLLRADMSEAQREQLSALLDDIYGVFVRDVAASRGRTTQEVRRGWRWQGAGAGMLSHAAAPAPRSRPTPRRLPPSPAACVQVEDLLDEGVFDMELYKQRGFVTDLLYECELEEMLKKRTGG